MTPGTMRRAIVALCFGLLAVIGLAVIPVETMDHVGSKAASAIAIIVADPAGAIGAATALLSVAAAVLVGARQLLYTPAPSGRTVRK